MSKRRFGREQVSFPLVYKVSGPLSARKEFGEGARDAIAGNLSERGLRIFVHDNLPVGTVLTLKFTLIRASGSPTRILSGAMELEAEVRHSSPGLIRGSYIIGVNFIRPSASDTAFIAGSQERRQKARLS